MARLPVLGSLVLTAVVGIAAPVPKVEPPPTVFVLDGTQPVVMRADGTGVRRLSTKAWAEPVLGGALSPDGKRAALILATKYPNDPPGVTVRCGKIVVRDLTDDGKGTDTGLDGHQYCWVQWTADGAKLYGGWHDSGAPPEGGAVTRKPAWRGWTYDLAKKKRADIALPGDHAPTHQTRDGKYWVSFHMVGMGERFFNPNADKWEYEVHLADTTTLATKKIFGSKDGYMLVGVPATEGKLLVRVGANRERPHNGPPLLVGLADKSAADKSAVEVEVPKGALVGLTTDGKYILYVERSEKADDKAEPWRLIAAEISGKNPTAIYRSAKELILPTKQ